MKCKIFFSKPKGLRAKLIVWSVYKTRTFFCTIFNSVLGLSSTDSYQNVNKIA